MSTTIGDMSIGASLVFGKYTASQDVQQEPQPIVWLKGTPNCGFITECAVDYLILDAREETGNERYYGNSNYELSNLHSFLNSEEAEWYVKTHRTDRPPEDLRSAVGYQPWASRYKSHYGFLHFFEDYELSAMSSAMRIPDASDIVGDGRMKLFRKKGIRPKASYDLAVCKTGCADISDISFVPFWVIATDCASTCIISRSGGLREQAAATGSGVRPICSLNPDTPVERREDGSFYIKPVSVRQNLFTDDELFELLGIAQP